MSEITLNREGWLTALARDVERTVFQEFRLSPYRITCGWPSRGAMSHKGQRLGECHSLASSKGSIHEIFITPALDNPARVAGVVTHELAHVVAGVQAGHGKEFNRICNYVGLTEGKGRSAEPGERLGWFLLHLLADRFPYPHQAMVLPQRASRRESNTIRLTCLDCGCRLSISKKWLNVSSYPTCGCGGKVWDSPLRQLAG